MTPRMFEPGCTYKLTYFNRRGIAEIVRILFNYVGQHYEDQRISCDDWAKLKANLKFGVLPVLEVTAANGVKHELSESMAIARIVAKHYGLMGKSDCEYYLIELALGIRLQTALKLREGNFFAGHSVTLADLLAINTYDAVSVITPTLIESSFSDLASHKKDVVSTSKHLQEYLKNRPVTPF
ncbi:unnamed protein product [Protopolystoma xenopodis]|uniref:GST N-terminal domain-containing protein n=1 Tax=Protopolystoma xenopodis TaxID=117903 RepID=A0A3S5FFN5_9PLAT|nr:unnamed protein product [Protopolystoma xenopodis]